MLVVVKTINSTKHKINNGFIGVRTIRVWLYNSKISTYSSNRIHYIDCGRDALSADPSTPADVYFVLESTDFGINGISFDIEKSIKSIYYP